MDCYSPWFSLNNTENNLLISFSSKPSLVRLGLSGEEKSFETSFLEERETNVSEQTPTSLSLSSNLAS